MAAAAKVTRRQHDYDVIVIGGGSGGLAASKECIECGAEKVLVFDYVIPTVHGTKWGLGGTCVNVGCVPKKLLHYAASLGSKIREDAPSYGWKIEDHQFDWTLMINTIQNHIKRLNFSYRVGLKNKGVEYINATAYLKSPHTVAYKDKSGHEVLLTTRYIIIAVGGRPYVPPDVEGALQYAITSDDLFSLKKPPGKTLIVGASYIALECAGALTELGFPTTVAVRSVPLRMFDQQCAEKVVQLMKEMGTKFINTLPIKIAKQADNKFLVSFDSDSYPDEVFDTVMYAIGRKADTERLDLCRLGIELDALGKIKAINEQSSVPSIYAIGDALHGCPELTPVAIKAGELLARRLIKGSQISMDYQTIPTTIFTPFEYGCCGYSEEEALKIYEEDELEIFLYEYKSLEIEAAHRHKIYDPKDDQMDTTISPNAFAKLICLRSQKNKIVGFHYVGPNAGEITQGFAVCLRMGATKDDFDSTLAIHPTDAEVFQNMYITKRSGKSWVASGGCAGGKCG